MAVPDLAKRVQWGFASAVLIALLLPLILGNWTPMIALGLMMAFWVIASLVISLRLRLAGEGDFMQRVKAQSLSYYGMQLAHLGVAIFIIGVTLVKGYETERDVRMNVGDTVQAGGYEFRFYGVTETTGPNYVAGTGRVSVSKNGRFVTELLPEKRQYNVSGMPITEAAINVGVFRDLYVSLGEAIPESEGAWSVRVYIKPFVDWIWFGCFLMAMGGVLAISDRRYRIHSKKSAAAQIVPVVVGSQSEGLAS
jgi:cytochrome c-type biogenesis protein CcmF